MSYNFKTQYGRDLHSGLSTVVPIAFIADDGMAECARMDFDEGSQRVEIRYKSGADELVDIAHELTHVRMQFQDGFPLLAWPSDHPPARDIEEAVKRIRDAVDDTYVLHELFVDTKVLPISQVFYREIRKDLEKGVIHIVQGLCPLSRPLATAWRLRLADLSCSEYYKCLTTSERDLAADFVSHFEGKDAAAKDLFTYLKQNVIASQLCSPQQLGCILIGLRDRLALPSWLHLATRQQINGKWKLRKS